LLAAILAGTLGTNPECYAAAKSQQTVTNQNDERPKQDPSGVSRATPEDLLKIPASTQKYAISVTGPTEPIKYGERFVLPVVLINISSSPVTLYIPFLEYQPEVCDADGKLLQPRFVPDEGPKQGILWDLQPGYKITTGDVLPKNYRDAMKPGKYSVRLTLDRVDWSNTITITVVP
jgi:hypothetical protein